MDIRNKIIESFKNQYGFAPAKKDMMAMEASGFGTIKNWEFTWVAFCINGIGYQYEIGGEVERAEQYDFMR